LQRLNLFRKHNVSYDLETGYVNLAKNTAKAVAGEMNDKLISKCLIEEEIEKFAKE